MALKMCARHRRIARRDAARVECKHEKRAIQTRLRAPECPRARGRARARLGATALVRFEVTHSARDRFDSRAIRRRGARTVDERLALKHAARFLSCLPRAFRAYGARARRRRR